MFEAVNAVIDRLFQTEDVDYINCGYLLFNDASKGLQQKLGFTYLTTEWFSRNGEKLASVENILWRKNIPARLDDR